MFKNVIISIIIAGAVSYLLFSTAEADASESRQVIINNIVQSD
ncbi:MAG: hypothetical protein OCC49_16365 [Fibrobacterales bacterium]